MKTTRSERRDLSQWSPFDQLSRLREEINRFFDLPSSSGRAASPMFEGWNPAVDVFESSDTITVRAELPGMKKEDIEVAIEGNMLAISGERREEKQAGQGASFRSERFFGQFYRTIPLPTATDPAKVNARYQEGILTVTLPKAEEAKRRQIDVQMS